MVMNPTKGTLPLFAHNNQYVTRSYGVCGKTSVHLYYRTSELVSRFNLCPTEEIILKAGVIDTILIVQECS